MASCCEVKMGLSHPSAHVQESADEGGQRSIWGRDRVLFRPWLLPGRVERVDGSTSVLDRPVSDVLTLQFLGPAQPGVRQHGHRGARGDA